MPVLYFRTWTFWIAVCTWLIFMGGHYAAIVPPPYGLVLANAVALVYGILRCLQKRKAGIPWKGILFTSEFVVTSVTVLMNFLESLTALPAMPPKVLAVLSASIVALGSLLHTLSGTKKDLPPVAEIMDSLAKDNLSGAVSDQSSPREDTKPRVPIVVKDDPTDPSGTANKTDSTDSTNSKVLGPIAHNWYEYSVSTDDSKNVSRTVYLDPSWDKHEVLSYLVKHEFQIEAEKCTVKVLHGDGRGMRVFEVVDDANKVLTFVRQRYLGQWHTE